MPSQRVGPPLGIQQAIEYLLGLGIVLMALHGNANGHWLVVVVGGACVGLAGITKGSLGAVHLLGARAHRIGLVVVAVGGLVAVVVTGQLTKLDVLVPILVAAALLLRLAWMGQAPQKRPKATKGTKGTSRSMSAEDVGRMAGRASGQLVRRWRERDR